jgi:hypothetical protein
MRQVLFRLGLVLAIAASIIVLAWFELPVGSMAASVPIWGVVGVMIGSLIGAVILRAGAAWVERKDVRYADAYATMLLCGLASLVLSVVVRSTIGAAAQLDIGAVLLLHPEIASGVHSVAAFVVAFLIHAGSLVRGMECRSAERAWSAWSCSRFPLRWR